MLGRANEAELKDADSLRYNNKRCMNREHHFFVRCFRIILAEDEMNVVNDDEIYPDYPKAFFASYKETFAREPEVIDKSIIEPILVSIIENVKMGCIQYLAECYQRCHTYALDLPEGHGDIHHCLKFATDLIIRYSMLVLKNPEKIFHCSTWSLIEERGTKQLVRYLGNLHSKEPPAYLKHLMRKLENKSPGAFPSKCLQGIFKAIEDNMSKNKKWTLLTPNCTMVIKALHLLLSVHGIPIKFVSSNTFMPPWLNGYRMETTSSLGIISNLTPLPDCASVGDEHFKDLDAITDAEIEVKVQELRDLHSNSIGCLTRVWRSLLAEPTSRSGLLGWIGCSLLSNFERTRMRPHRKSTSTDAFLLNMVEVMIRILFELLPENDAETAIDGSFLLRTSRWNYQQDTRIRTTLEDIQSFAAVHYPKDEEMKQSEGDVQFLRDCIRATHDGIVCDKCRKKSMTGVRYKCANCRDFDLCADCEEKEYMESLGLSELSGVTFECPYNKCDEKDFSEVQLKDHVNEQHAHADTFVTCPICLVNGRRELMFQPVFSQHLEKQHCDNHDPRTHTFLRLSRMVPQAPGNQFSKLPTFDVEEHVGEAAFLSSEVKEHDFQHEGVRCFNCSVTPIVGVAYVCYNCPPSATLGKFTLCSKCANEDSCHDPSHVFLKFRKPSKSNLSEIPAVDSLYPSALIGSCGFDLLTEWFFLTIHTLHLGMIRTCTRYSVLLQGMRGACGDKLNQFTKIKLCVDTQLLRPGFIDKVMDLYAILGRWVLSLVERNGVFCDTASMQFCALPEYFFEDICEFLTFISKHKPDLLILEKLRPIIHLFVQCLKNSKFIKNPYLRAKFVEVICALGNFSSQAENIHSSLRRFWEEDELVLNTLIPSLFQLFIDIEHTGSDGQFYDKFNCRHGIGVLSVALLSIPSHMNKLRTLSADHLLTFISCVINDSIFLLDESVSRIKQVEDARAIRQRVGTPENDRNVLTSERALQTVAVLAGSSVNLLWKLAQSEVTKDILLRPEMIERVAHFINFYIVRFCGEESEQAQLDDGERLKYDLGAWVGQFASMYLVLSDSEKRDEFMRHVVDDGRCYRPKAFKACRQLLGVLQTPHFDLQCLKELDTFFAQLEEIESEMKEDDLGEIPERFLDPIMNTLMKDPVILPTSGQVVDRAVILRHLLSEKTDPFSRTDLRIEDVIPDDKRRQKIQEFIKSKKSHHRD